MKTIEQILNWKKKEGSQCLDGRDLSRLIQFLTEEQITSLGLKLKEEFKGKHKVKKFTRENILKELETDVAFGFEKALNKRGISSGLMYAVVQMWNWILEEGLENFDDYPQYGLPLFKATAVKYGFPNPIGKNTGKEKKYEG